MRERDPKRASRRAGARVTFAGWRRAPASVIALRKAGRSATCTCWNKPCPMSSFASTPRIPLAALEAKVQAPLASCRVKRSPKVSSMTRLLSRNRVSARSAAAAWSLAFSALSAAKTQRGQRQDGSRDEGGGRRRRRSIRKGRRSRAQQARTDRGDAGDGRFTSRRMFDRFHRREHEPGDGRREHTAGKKSRDRDGDDERKRRDEAREIEPARARGKKRRAHRRDQAPQTASVPSRRARPRAR